MDRPADRGDCARNALAARGPCGHGRDGAASCGTGRPICMRGCWARAAGRQRGRQRALRGWQRDRTRAGRLPADVSELDRRRGLGWGGEGDRPTRGGPPAGTGGLVATSVPSIASRRPCIRTAVGMRLPAAAARPRRHSRRLAASWVQSAPALGAGIAHGDAVPCLRSAGRQGSERAAWMRPGIHPLAPMRPSWPWPCPPGRTWRRLPRHNADAADTVTAGRTAFMRRRGVRDRRHGGAGRGAPCARRMQCGRPAYGRRLRVGGGRSCDQAVHLPSGGARDVDFVDHWLKLLHNGSVV